jgi:hypothetical protein
MVQLTQVSKPDSVRDWRIVNVNRKSDSPRPHSIDVEQIFTEYRFERVPGAASQNFGLEA